VRASERPRDADLCEALTLPIGPLPTGIRTEEALAASRKAEAAEARRGLVCAVCGRPFEAQRLTARFFSQYHLSRTEAARITIAGFNDTTGSGHITRFLTDVTVLFVPVASIPA
jgi:hypothetical protein